MFVGLPGPDAPPALGSALWSLLAASLGHRDLTPVSLLVGTSVALAASTAVGLLDGVRTVARDMTRTDRFWSIVGLLIVLWLGVAIVRGPGRADYAARPPCTELTAAPAGC
jgi:hypothetical protein